MKTPFIKRLCLQQFRRGDFNGEILMERVLCQLNCQNVVLLQKQYGVELVDKSGRTWLNSCFILGIFCTCWS